MQCHKLLEGGLKKSGLPRRSTMYPNMEMFAAYCDLTCCNFRRSSRQLESMRQVAVVALLAAASLSAVVAFDADAAMSAFMKMMVDDSKFHAPQVATSGRSSTGHRDANYVPVVLMHGLGDAGDNPGMRSLANSVKETYPGIYSVGKLCFHVELQGAN